MLDAHKAQEDFLCKIRRVRFVAQPPGEKAPQSLAVARGDRGDEVLSGVVGQGLNLSGEARL
jgi:hypothetical protein